MEKGERTDGTGGGPPTGESADRLERLFRDGRTNAIVSWALVGVLALVFVESAVEFDRRWVTFVAVVGAIVVVPPVASGDWRVMLPWELLALALLPILVHGLFRGDVGPFAYYLSLAGLALIITVELHSLTSVEMTHWFAVGFVVMTTMASVAAWAVVLWNFDRLFGTSYLSTNEALMVEFAWVTAAGFAAGLLFDAYFSGHHRRLWRWLRRVVGR